MLRMKVVKRLPLHRLAQIMGHNSLDTTMVYARGARKELQRLVEGVTAVPRGVER